MHATRLLRILNDFAGMTFLPRTTKTLLGSNRGKLNFKDIPPGRYYHSGVEAGLLKVMLTFKDMGITIPNVVEIIFNVDDPFHVIKYKCIRIPTCFPEIGTFFVSRLLNLKVN